MFQSKINSFCHKLTPYCTRFETSAGSDTMMEVRVCGEPRPLVQWKVDHLVLAAGSGHGRYKAHSLHKMASHPNCYISRLSVLAADSQDSKTYQITVENVLGAETHSLELRVHGETNARINILFWIYLDEPSTSLLTAG